MAFRRMKGSWAVALLEWVVNDGIEFRGLDWTVAGSPRDRADCWGSGNNSGRSA